MTFHTRPTAREDRRPSCKRQRELRPGVIIEVPEPGDFEELTRMLNEALRPGSSISLDQDLPLLVGRLAPSIRLIVRTEGRIVAHAALYVHAYRMLNHAFNVGIIGAVATSEGARGRGFASALVRELLVILPDHKVQVCALWSQAPGFYERLGFVCAGREIIHTATREGMPEPEDSSRVRPARQADLPALRVIHNQEPSLTIRTAHEWDTWLGLPETSFFVLEHQGGISSYGVLGKGLDLQGCVHEWGGPEHLLPLLLGGMLAQCGRDELYVMSPPWKRAASELMNALGAEATTGYLGMLRITDPASFCQDLGTHHIDEETILQHASLVTQLFGCGEEKADGMRTPLPFYLFGLDSM